MQTLSRFGLAYLLAQSGTLKDTWLSVCAPGGAQGPPADADDIELEKPEHRNRWMLGRIMGQGKQDGALGDAMAVVGPRAKPFRSSRQFLLTRIGVRPLGNAQQFTKHFPKLRSAHLFPGYVFTSVLLSLLTFSLH